MNKTWRTNIIRGIIVLIVQLILLKRIDITFGDFNYIHFSVYPIIFALLPYKTNKTALVPLGFFVGFFVDIFYDSLGVHAAASTFTCYARHYILNLLSPVEGYGKGALTAFKYGLPWFVGYLSALLFVHLLILYGLEAFSLVYIKEILLRTVFSFIASLFAIMLGILIFNPKY